MNDVTVTTSIDRNLAKSFEDFRRRLNFGYFNNLSEKTRIAYAKDLEQFREFLNEHFRGIEITAVEIEHILAFQEDLKNSGGIGGKKASDSTIKRKLAAVSSFFDYLIIRKVLKYNPVKLVKRPKAIIASKTQDLKDSDVKILLGSIDRSELTGKMHFALLTVLFYTGLRKNEVIKLTLGDLQHENEIAYLQCKTKGGKSKKKKLHPEAIDGITDYLLECEKLGFKMDLTSPLIRPTKAKRVGEGSNYSRCEKELNPNTVNKIMAKYVEFCGLKGNFSPHSARATFIGHLIDKGEDIHRVAFEVGHENISTTLSYYNRKKELKDSLVDVVSY